MPVTLAEAKNNAQDDFDPFVIDEFRKESAILDTLVFDDVVNPAGGGATLDYGYRRLATQAVAGFRALNTEYTPQNVVTSKHSVTLATLGGAFEVDRVIAKIGPAASGAVTLNLQQKIKATRARFQDEVLNGDLALVGDEMGFDGLDKALRGTSTEMGLSTVTDWTDFDTVARAEHKALDLIDEFLSLLDGSPTIILGNSKALARVRAAARRAGQYTQDPVSGLIGANGRPIVRESYGGIVFADPGAKAGTNDPIIPIRKQGNVTIEVTAVSGSISFALNGKVVTVAYNASAATLETELEKVVPDATVTKASSTFTVLYPVGRTAVFTTVTDGGVTIADATAGNAPATGLTDLYAYRVGLDGFHGVSIVGGQLVETFLPDFTTPGAVKKGEVELGPIGVALKATKAAAVLRAIKVQ